MAMIFCQLYLQQYFADYWQSNSTWGFRPIDQTSSNSLKYFNRAERIRHLRWKTAVLSCRKCIKTLVLKK
jgi:hypothetical protein